ncbi:DUF5696 domain-containing protein [Paenibacillus sp. D51F]
MTKWKQTAAGLLCAGLLLGGIAGLGSWRRGTDDKLPAESAISASSSASVGESKATVLKAGSSSSSAPSAVPATAAIGTAEAAPADRQLLSANTKEELAALAAMEPAADNGTLALYVNRATAEIAVKDKRDGYAWFSNPPARDSDPKASGLYKAELASQVLLDYYNDKGQRNSMNSFTDSVQKNQFTIEKTDRGLKILYRIGMVSSDYGNIPRRIGKERFEQAILAKIADEAERKDVGYKFRYIEAEQVYEIRKLQDYSLKALSEKLASIGYTAEEAARDNGERAGSAASADKPEFTVPLHYELDGEHLLVRVPASELEFTKTYPIASLQVLKYFGAADEKKEGYIFVPDGSGALIHLNNGKLNAEPYIMPVYGEDSAFDVEEKVQRNETTRLPVYGMKQNDHAFLGMIEGGDAMADITADIGGRNDSYNTVSPKFRIVSMDFYTMTSGTKSSSVPMFQRASHQGDLQVRYGFLGGAAASYSGMAAHYRDLLVKAYDLKKRPQTDAPFLLEVAGAITDRRSFLGIPYESTVPLTSYREAQNMLSMLKERGVENIALRYAGWFNGGIRHDSPSKITPVGALGGSQGLQELAAYARQNGIGFYPDVAFLEAYEKPAKAASFLDTRQAKIYDYDPVAHVKDMSSFSHYLLSPTAASGLVDRFLRAYGRLGIDGISLRDLGDEVHSDFNPSHPASRQEARTAGTEAVKRFKEQAIDVMVNGGNGYSLPLASIVVNAPTGSSRANITDEDVPFYQIALHGYYDLAGTPFNADERMDPRFAMLKALETGSNLYYRWSYSPSSSVKGTRYDGLYSLHYADWLEESASLYAEANQFLKNVRGMAIADHRKLADQVFRTTFENGVTIIVNYNKFEVQVEGAPIAALGYRQGGG